MIVRITGEGQYRVTDEVVDRINEVDNRLVNIVLNNDQATFARVFHELLEAIRSNCQRIPDEELVESDVILPHDDTTFEEAKDLFLGEGILPG